MMTPVTRSLTAVALACLVAACASSGVSRLPPEQAVAKNAETRWQALLAGEFDRAYQLLSPGYRQTVALDDYQKTIAGRGIKWTGATVTSVACDSPQRCNASVTVDFSLTHGLPGVKNVASKSMVQETWIEVDGAWYYLPRRAAR